MNISNESFPSRTTQGSLFLKDQQSSWKSFLDVINSSLIYSLGIGLRPERRHFAPQLIDQQMRLLQQSGKQVKKKHIKKISNIYKCSELQFFGTSTERQSELQTLKK